MLDPSVVAVMRDALADAPQWHELRTRVERAAPEGEEERYRALVFAFGYALIAASHREHREREGGPFGVMIAQGDWSFPPPLSKVSDADVAIWTEAIDQLEGPVAKARLHDLLWERRVQPRPDLHARAAAGALLELVDLPHWHVMERTTCLARALELATTIKDPELHARATTRAVTFVEEVIARGESAPGAALTIIRAFVDMRPEHQPAALPALMASATKRFGDDPHIFDSLSELKARLVGAEQQLEVRREQVARWRDESMKGDTMLRVIRLEQALEIARTYGLTAEADELRRELQNIRPEDLDFKTISATTEIPTEAVEEWIESIAGQRDWREALRHFGSDGPPGGSDDEIDQQLAAEREEFVFTRLFTRTVVGRDNAATRFRAADDVSRNQLERSDRRAFHARMMSGLYARALLAIDERHGRADHADLADFFATDLIGPQRGERMARALELFWDNQPDESAHLLVPRIESTIRDMARQIGLTVMREPIAEKPGGARTLGVLLRELAGAMPADGWHDYIHNVLADQFGLNLRNDISHGLIDSVAVGDAALLLHIALFLRLLGISSTPPSPVELPDD